MEDHLNISFMFNNQSISRQHFSPHFLYVCLYTTVLIILYGYIDYNHELFQQIDLVKYWDIADASPGIAAGIRRPWAYRLLGPYVIGLLPIDVPLGFYFLSLTSSIALVILFFKFLQNF